MNSWKQLINYFLNVRHCDENISKTYCSLPCLSKPNKISLIYPMLIVDPEKIEIKKKFVNDIKTSNIVFFYRFKYSFTQRWDHLEITQCKCSTIFKKSLMWAYLVSFVSFLKNLNKRWAIAWPSEKDNTTTCWQN